MEASVERPVPHRGLVTVACLMAQFMAAVEGTIVGAATPTIAGDLGNFELFSWVFGAYMLAQAAGTPVYGKLADIYGRKRVFFAGCGLFLVSSLLCGLAWGMVPLIVFRFLQGLGAGAVQPIAWTIMGDIYNPADRARMQGWLSGTWATSALGGPVLGAFIVQHLHWSLIFWINLPVGVAALYMMGRYLTETAPRRRQTVDYGGALLLMLATGALLAALVQGPDLPLAATLGLVAFGLAAAALLVWHERRVAEPIVPFILLQRRVLAIGNAASLLVGLFIMVNTVFLPTFIQGGMGLTPVFAGFAIGCSSVGWTTGSVIGGRLMLRTSYRVTAVVGAVIAMAAVGALTWLRPDSPSWAPLVGTLVGGLGMGFCNTTFMIVVQTAVGYEMRGAATSVSMFMRTMGQALGSGLFGAIFNIRLAAAGPGSAGLVNRLLEPGGRAALAPGIVARLAGAIGSAMHDVYLVTFAVAVVILALSWLLPAALSPTRRAATAAGD